MFRYYLLIVALILAVDLNKARFEWNWAQGTGGLASAFSMKCGSESGNYTNSVRVEDVSVTQMPLSSLVASPGEYYCAVSAVNEFGESAVSNEVHFKAGLSPLPPQSNRIVSE